MSGKTGRLAIGLILAAADLTGAADTGIETVRPFLPSGATFETFPKAAQDGRYEFLPAVVSGGFDLSSSGIGTAFIYRRSGLLGLRLVLSRAMTSEKTVFDAPLTGTYAQTIDGIEGPILIKRLVPGREAMIVVATTESGASAGSALNVFEVRAGVLRSATGGPIEGSRFGIDCPGTDACRLLAMGKWTDRSSAWLDAWVWNGEAYVGNRIEADRYMQRKLSELAAEAGSNARLAVGVRVRDAETAAAKYLEFQNYEQVLSLTRDVLARLSDKDLSLPREGAAGKLEADIEAGKALILEIAGRTYQAMGRTADAAEQFSRARRMRAVTGQ